jgi:hypothetical protein
MATPKKTETPEPLKMWEDYSKSYTDMVVEMTQRSFDQSLALSEQIAGIWMDAAKKTQDLMMKETEAAMKLAEETQAQMKTASDKVMEMTKNFSAN